MEQGFSPLRDAPSDKRAHYTQASRTRNSSITSSKDSPSTTTTAVDSLEMTIIRLGRNKKNHFLHIENTQIYNPSPVSVTKRSPSTQPTSFHKARSNLLRAGDEREHTLPAILHFIFRLLPKILFPPLLIFQTS